MLPCIQTPVLLNAKQGFFYGLERQKPLFFLDFFKKPLTKYIYIYNRRVKTKEKRNRSWHKLPLSASIIPMPPL